MSKDGITTYDSKFWPTFELEDREKDESLNPQTREDLCTVSHEMTNGNNELEGHWTFPYVAYNPEKQENGTYIGEERTLISSVIPERWPYPQITYKIFWTTCASFQDCFLTTYYAIVGCFGGEESIDALLLPLQTEMPIVKPVDTDSLLRLELPTVRDTRVFNLSKVIDWKTNVIGCGATQVELCSDKFCDTPLTIEDEMSLRKNPTLKDRETGQLHPLLIINTENFFERTVFLKANTNTDSVSTVVGIEILVGETEEESKVFNVVKTLSNTLPKFESPLESMLVVKVVREASGDIREPNTFRYVSPIAKDTEGNAIKYSFGGLKDKIWASVRVNDDGSFLFKVDKSLVKPEDAGSYEARVTLGDEV